MMISRSDKSPVDDRAMARLAQYLSQEEYLAARIAFKRGHYRMAVQFQQKAAKLHQRMVYYLIKLD